jgi:PPP family 3-phenylpropionic acid transporter
MQRTEGGGEDSALLRLGLIYGGVFSVLGVSTPFWPLFLEGRGLDAVQIGLVFTVGIWVRTLAGPAWCAFADQRGSHRRTMQGLAAGTVLAMSLFLLPLPFPGLLLVMGLASVTWPAIVSLLDAATIGACRLRGVDYGRVRLWGSIAFLLANGVAGSFLVGRSSEWVLFLLLLLYVLVFAASFLLPAGPAQGAGPRASFASLFGVRSILLLLLATLAIQGSHAAYYAFSSIHWQASGLSRSTIGVLWAEGVLAEVVLFALAGRWQGWRPSNLLALGAFAAVLRWGLLSATTSVGWLALAQLLHAFTFGATHLAGVRWLARRVPEARTASAQALFGAFASGIGPGLAMPLAGWCFESSPALAFRAMAALAAVGLCAALWLRRRGQAHG